MGIHGMARKIADPVRATLKTACGAIPPRLRLGRVFWETYRFLQHSQEWDAAQLEDYQMRELERLLTQCYEHVPYYRRVFDERGLKPSQIQSAADLARLPSLRKDQIRKEPEAFLADNRSIRRLRRQVTTGTTGQPFQFYLDHNQLQREWAFACHIWSRVGYRPGDARAELWGPRIEGPRPYWWDPMRRILRLCPVLGDEQTVQLYLEMMRSHEIRFLYGHASSITYMASLIKRYDVQPALNLTAILFASETLYPWQRRIAEEVFGCRSSALYGLSEEIAIAGDCEVGGDYHFVPQYGVVELDPQTGEIIGTGFLNHAQPFVRYRTGDMAILPAGRGCEKCGRQYYPVVPGIEGRLQEFVLTPEGIPLNSCTLSFPFKPRKTIARVQIVQESIDRVVLRTAPLDDTNPGSYTQELALARRVLQQVLGQGMTIREERISPEEYAVPGKLRFIVSHLPREVRGYERTTSL